MQAALTLLLVCGVAVSSSQPGDPSLDSAWADWKTLHGKQYTEEDSEGYRRQVWEENLRFIEQHNLEHSQGKHSYTLGMNHFGDLTHEEFTGMAGFRADSALDDTAVSNWTRSTGTPPPSLDWRTKGYVTPVKDQGKCHSCWAFSAAGALEGLHFKKTRRLVALSEQNLVDCVKGPGYKSKGCNKGYMHEAFKYISLHGIASERTYPYNATDGNCRYTNAQKAASCTGYTFVPSESERALTDILASVGPISVAVNMHPRTFRFYKKGECMNNVTFAFPFIIKGQS
ncbi:CATS protein, partial [Amia calva]|nr:CATS protein [Amia calva]